MPENIISLAKMAYEEYCSQLKRVNPPDWEHLADDVREAWIGAVAVIAGRLSGY